MIIKMVNKFNVFHFACPNWRQICASMWIYHWKIRTGPTGHHRPWVIMGCRALGCGPAFSKTPENPIK